jgi:diguanylate cyclase (GGDEF)-like protein
LDLVARDLRTNPAVSGFVVVAHDVTGWAEREAAYRGKLDHDMLTGLGNRASLITRLQQAARSSPSVGRRAAVLFADLDSFKVINDRFGHAVGDAILCETAGRLVAVLGDRGSAFRMGGDEFVILLDRVDENEAAELGEAVLAAVREPIAVPGAREDPERIEVSVSIGIAMVDGDRGFEQLMAGADMAMYRAKGAGRDRVEFYTADLRDWALARKKSVETLAVQVQQLQSENRALAEAVTTDFRTGLANTAAFDSDHAQRFALFKRTDEPYAVLLVDIDHFHDYNCAYGYLKGNETLRLVATTLASALRQGDRAYRYGGEEFAALLPSTRADGAKVVAERVRSEVEALRQDHPTNPGGMVTVTIGVLEAVPTHGSPEEVFEAVNALLLYGKDSGRNRVVTARS